MAFNFKLATLFVDILVRNSAANNSLNNTKNSITGIVGLASRLYVLRIAFEGITQAVGSLFKATADLEANFGIIQRVTDMSSEQLVDFKEKLLEVSTALKGIGVTEFQQTVQAAAQLGFVGDELLEFSQVAAKLANVSTDLNFQESARALGVFLNVFNEGSDRANELAGALLRVSNVSNATSGEIINISERLAGYAKTIGLTAEQVFALSAATKDAGVKNEVAASTFVALFQRLTTEPQKVAQSIGLVGDELKQFIQNIDTNPIAAITQFFKELHEMAPAQISNLLKDLGIGDVRQVPTLQSLARIYENIERNLDVVADRTANLNKLQTDSVNKAGELHSRVNDLDESWTRLKANLGNSDFFRIVISDMQATVDSLNFMTTSFGHFEAALMNVFGDDSKLKELMKAEMPEIVGESSERDRGLAKARKDHADAAKRLQDEKNKEFRNQLQAEEAAKAEVERLEEEKKKNEEIEQVRKRILDLRQQALTFVGGDALGGIIGQLLQAQNLISDLRGNNLLSNDLLGLIKGQLNVKETQKIEFQDPTALWKKQQQVQKENPQTKQALDYLKKIATDLLPDLTEAVQDLDITAVGP